MIPARSRRVCLLLILLGAALQAAPIRLDPDNPRWFRWRGRTCALIASGEHYGLVLNRDFDAVRYLRTLQRDGLNYTRAFAGTYVEPAGAFGIARNTLAPAPGRFLAPWARGDTEGYAGGGLRFDLDRFDPAYLDRLHAVLDTAAASGVVVELTLFCSTYGEAQWRVHPLNPVNNVQHLAVGDWRRLHTTDNGPAVMAVQEALVRHLVRALNRHDNLFYEIQNEPWADNSTAGEMINPYLRDRNRWPNAVQVTAATSVAWQRRIARVIRETEASLPQRHLIAQNVANFRLSVSDADRVPEADILNFHYAYPEVVGLNRGWDRVIGYDETGFAGTADLTYRRQAWNFVMAGGGLFNQLDYSFTLGHEDGSDTENRAPGGGSAALRRQLRVLREALIATDLRGVGPHPNLVAHAPGCRVRVLGDPGRVYLVYLEGRGPTRLRLALPQGSWRTDWIDIGDGRVLAHDTLPVDGEPVSLTSPGFTADVALRLTRDSR